MNWRTPDIPMSFPEVHYTVVRAALGQMGVGGDDSWGSPHTPGIPAEDR